MSSRPRDKLPAPGPEASRHSARLVEVIRRDIAEQDGWISFARYMELALYAPGLGYYTSGTRKLGVAGDFVTAPEISPLFGRTLARQIAEIMKCSEARVLEFGAGSGILAVDVLWELELIGSLPDSYEILDVSADLRARQRELIKSRIPHLAGLVHWLENVPGSYSGAIVANELLDALPVHLLHWHGGTISERGVVWDGQSFSWQDRAVSDTAILSAVQNVQVPDDYISEVCPAAKGLINSLSQSLDKGALLFIDYGFGCREFYHPERRRGTLMCHYRHHAHDDPFFQPGLQDITAHVNFSYIAECGIDAGLTLMGYTNQAFFLVNCGITDLLNNTSATPASERLANSAQLQKLTSPAEMGELFKVMCLGKLPPLNSVNGQLGILSGFRNGDLTRLL
jgi:SAM-dependent MidA family methyltransferase